MIFGAPQIAALVVLLQRALENLHAARNTKRLLAEGAREVGRRYYPVVVVTHLGWIAAVFFLIPGDAPVYWPVLAVFLLLQVARYWIIGSLGRLWTTRIITRDDMSMVRHGPFRFLRHPNYVVVVLEVVTLPLAFGAWWVALCSGLVIGAALAGKIRLEEGAVATRRANA